MPRGSGISIRDRLIVWNSICKGINKASAIKKIFEDTDERDISLDSIVRIVKEYDEFKQFLPQYPQLIEDLKVLISSGGIPSISYSTSEWKYSSLSSDKYLSGKVVCATVKNVGAKTMSKVHAHLVITAHSTNVPWIDDMEGSVDIPPASQKTLGIINTVDVITNHEDEALYEKILSRKNPQVMGAPERKLPHSEGSWVSTKESLIIPSIGDSYLLPGEYAATLILIYDDNREFRQDLKIFSPALSNEPRVESK